MLRSRIAITNAKDSHRPDSGTQPLRNELTGPVRVPQQSFGGSAWWPPLAQRARHPAGKGLAEQFEPEAGGGTASSPSWDFSKISIVAPDKQEAGRALAQTGKVPEMPMDAASAHVDPVVAGPGTPLSSALRQDTEEHFDYDFSRVRVHTASSLLRPAPQGERGRALDADTRGRFAAHLGQDFSGVRVHTDPQSATSARALHAQAFTSGQDVFFGAGQYSPRSRSGEQLLAHELAHVLQQRRGGTGGTDGGAAAEREADRVAFAVGAGGPVPSIRERAPGGLQCKSEGGVKLAAPSADSQDPTTSRIEDAYGSGSLDEKQWKAHVEAARNAIDGSVKQREYELLFRDVARLAEASAVLGDDKINWLAGAKPHDNKSYRPGLNLTPFGSSDLGAAGFTGFVNAKGEFFDVAPPLEPGGPSVQVAIVMTVDDFNSGKEYALAVLRHEMMHAVHAREALLALAEFEADTKKGAAKSKKDLPRVQFHQWVEQQQKRGRYSPVDAAVIEESAQTATVAGSPNSELLAHFEGFMTRFHLSKPPIKMNDPVFEELGGALETIGPVFPWRSADPAVRAEVLGRFRKYYLEALDKPHRDAFREWVSFQMTKVQTDRALEGRASGSLDDKTLGDLNSAIVNKNARENRMHAHFFRSLQEMLAQVEKPATPMALTGR